MSFIKDSEIKTRVIRGNRVTTGLFIPPIKWTSLYRLKSLSAKHVMVFLGIVTAMKLNRDKGSSFKKIPQEITKGLGLDSSRLSKIVKDLERLHLINVERVSGHKNRFKLIDLPFLDNDK